MSPDAPLLNVGSMAPERDPTAVSKGLRARALSALRELLKGFQRAALPGSIHGHESRVCAGLVSLILRMVFLLFAEERGLSPMETDAQVTSRSLTILHDRLRQDRDRDGRAIEDRVDAWPHVMALFHRIYEARGGGLFDPSAAPFLDGVTGISNGALLRVLDHLRVPAGDLEVEHLGAAYEGLMGFEVQVALGPSLTLQPEDVVVDLDRLAALDGAARIVFLADEAGLELKGKIATAVAGASGASELLAVLSARASAREPHPISKGRSYLQPGEARRRAGAHYTSRAMTAIMVDRTLGPLLGHGISPDEILALRVCDPAMGSGAFLVEACRQLGDRLVESWNRTGTLPVLPTGEDPVRHARRLVAKRCLYGVDRNAIAVDLARLSSWLVAFAREEPLSFVDHALRHGDSLVGLSREQIASFAIDVRGKAPTTTTRAIVGEKVREALSRGAGEGRSKVRATGDLLLAAFFSTQEKKDQARAMATAADLAMAMMRGEIVPVAEGLLAALRARHVPFHWEIELPEIFGEGRKGFDAILGNPPWVSYAGRAAQPLADDLRDFYMTTSPAFHGYRNLQGVFVHRAAELLRPGGRLGLVLPTSMCDLGGYEPSRRAHDELCACDASLPDFGDKGFDGVFQPSMGLLSTRRSLVAAIPKTGVWPLERSDLDDATATLLDRLGALPPMPAHLFGERGFQSMGDDVSRLHAILGPTGSLTTGVRTGSDIEPFLRRPPELYCDPSVLGGRFRAEAEWRAVKLYIRQTARYPMVALSDGQAFRNSILAGFSDDDHSEYLLIAYLNSSPLRWYHYMRHRDARQGMPQMKIGHLRALPAPPRDAVALSLLERIGRDLGDANGGISAADQQRIDSVAADLLGLDASARARISAWAKAVRG